MQNGDIPHACFRFDPVPLSDARSHLRKVLECQLEARFDQARVLGGRLLGGSLAATLTLASSQFVAVLGPSKYVDGEWVLLISHEDRPTFFGRLFKKNLTSNNEELRLACRRIHEALISSPEIGSIRWYFEGRKQPQAVLTPDELLWIDSAESMHGRQ